MMESTICNSPSFQWGRKNLNNSVMSRRIANSPTRERTGLNKIDARIYADVQSRGLASRIVKYHESGTKLSRSISMNNLTSESRQFPARRTSKPELPYKASKQNVSMTHIAPPDKSAFYGNTLSGLLRSSSVITLQHNDDDISSENRPIIHPPVTEKELQPTRSVLEVLKEISRKRINNEDVDESDTSKKYCNRIDGDMNGAISSIPPDYRNIQTPQTYKRQRESAAECFNSNRIEQNGYHMKPPPPQNRQEGPSPEQHAKRRHCNYNNDITSSLSSSKKSNNKRKLFEYEGDKQQEKQLRFQPEIRLPELSTALSYVAKTPITPIPNTPQSGLSHSISSNEIPLPVPVQKCISAPEATETSVRNIKAIAEKPKLTLFNKNYETVKGEFVNDRALDAEDDAYAGIQFVKPKKSASTIGDGSASHLLMERTQKSKLALMLSGLRGELYLGDKEEKPVEVPRNKVEDKPINITSEAFNATDNSKTTNGLTVTSTLPTATSADVPTTSTMLQPTLTTNVTNGVAKVNTNVVDGSTATSTGFSLSTTNPTTTTSSTKISSPLTGIKLTPQTTATNAVTSIPSVAPIASVAPTFSFGIGTVIPSTSTTNSIVSKPSTVSLPDSAPKVTTPFTMGTPTQIDSIAAAPKQPPLLPTFGEATAQSKLPTFTVNPAATVTTTSIPTTMSSATLPPAFTFNPNPASTTVSASAAVATTSTITNAVTLPMFAFGNAGAQPTSTEIPKTTAVAAPSFSFGTNKPSGGFSFAATANTSTTNATPATEASKMFSFTSPKTSIAANAGGFSFGGNTAESKSTATNVFGNNAITPIKFGASATTEQQQQPNVVSSQPATNNAFLFGGKPTDTAIQDKTVTPNTFGALAGNNQSKPFSFGAGGNTTTTTTTAEVSKTTNIFSLPNNNSNKLFSFGGSTANTTTPTPAPPTTINTFSLANNNNNNNNNQSNLFSFSGSNSNAKTTPAETPKPNNTFSFGSKPFNFGGVANAEAAKPAFGSDQVKSFSFGGTNNTIASTDATNKASNTFNFSTHNQTNPFSFGGGGNHPNNTEPPKMLGNAAANNTSTNAFSFGAGKPELTQNSTFGAAPNSGQNNVFNFSGGNNNGAATAATNATATKPVNPTFNTFANSGQGNTFTFGSGGNTISAATPSTAAVAKPPTFGEASNSATQSNAFMFGGGSNNNATPASSTGNLFAMPNNVNSNPPPAFGSAGSTTGTPANANIFAVSPSSDRPIRRATRRLTKF